MAYLVLARKYRPQKFSEVVGQPHVVRTLQNALRMGRLAHALLFSGIRGVGKTTVARIVAKALNCENGEPDEPCNTCIPCREITEGRSMDVIEIDAASNRGIDEIRQLRENLKFMPTRGRAKVYIIDEAHMLTREAANALLKSLEEPPPHVYFILATTEPHRLPVTILSRCQRYDFKRLPINTLVEYLKEICTSEGVEIEETALVLIARESEGSLRDALSLLDQALAYGVKTREELLQAFGFAETEMVEALARALIRRDLAEVFRLSEEAYRKGVDLIYLSENLTEFFRNLLSFKISPEGLKEDLSPAEAALLREFSMDVETEEALLLFQHLLKGTEALKRSHYPHLSFELTLARICEIGKVVSLREIFQKLKELSEKYPEIPAQTGVSRRSEKSPYPKSSLSWEEILSEIKNESPALAAFLSTLEAPLEEGDRLVLSVPPGGLLEDEDLRERLKGLVFKKTGRELEIRTKTEEHNFREKLLERPEVKEALAIFGGKIAWIKPHQRSET
ncbi:DNA polymerase III subunit gamma/tau [Thermosulfurimonas dismutans]|uniref:DNA polymerase III subunit gamma/tau n=1 Tax=Thermosulfurimonas dismutans TaxID=999894 RepID=A0A179D2Y4_9BACT|nr:DNA polymerase III subunit gamma/tau [Thermosulfurimonas dismutans]OAQ20406.1 DNA polymerase III subunits gamma and tau [Thermosulfurimonas dismutans]